LDLRYIAATRRDLDRDVQAGRFRDDLFFRLVVGRIELPPLRRREGDIALLARAFWCMLGGSDRDLAPDVLARFESYDWPGNVGELHNAVARQLALGDFVPDTNAPRDARANVDFLDHVVAEGKPLTTARQDVVDEFERRYLRRMLDLHGGHVGKAA